MSVKTTGAEFKRFYNDPAFWPEDVWHDDVLFLVNGKPCPDAFDMTTVEDADKIVIEGGVVLGGPHDGREPSVETHFNRWRKLQTTVTLVVDVDRTKLDEVMAAIKAAGAKVVG